MVRAGFPYALDLKLQTIEVGLHGVSQQFIACTFDSQQNCSRSIVGGNEPCRISAKLSDHDLAPLPKPSFLGSEVEPEGTEDDDVLSHSGGVVVSFAGRKEIKDSHGDGETERSK